MTCQFQLERLNVDLRGAIQDGIDSGPAIDAEDVFAELQARYATPDSMDEQHPSNLTGCGKTGLFVGKPMEQCLKPARCTPG